MAAEIDEFLPTTLHRRYSSCPVRVQLSRDGHDVGRNWGCLRKSNELIAVFVHFTPSSIFRAAYADYCQAWNSLLDELSATKSFVFVYEDILSGKLPDTGEYFDGPYRKFVSDDKAISIIRGLYDRSIEVVPYRRRMDMTLRVQQALEDIEGGLFLRLYVPNGRLQSEQLVSLLRVLESYLQQVYGDPNCQYRKTLGIR